MASEDRRYEFNRNVNDAGLKAAATNSKATAKAPS
jgi:hypothetical protein